MKFYINKIKQLIKKHGKAKVAVELDVTDTRTIDTWLSRNIIPSKYLDKIKEMK